MMRIGKLNNSKLDELILSKFKKTRPEVVCSPRIGVDCAAVDMGGRLAVMSTDPITSADGRVGLLTVNVSCNDAAAAGAEPVGLLVTLLIPPDADEADVAKIADEIAAEAAKLNVEIIGGHTEVTPAVTRMVTCATVIAKAGENGIILPSGMKEGDDIVLTKWAGIEGTAVIVGDNEKVRKSLDEDELKAADGFMNEISVLKEGLYAASHGATAMHDVTEGGVLGAVWEMSDASGCGVEIFEDRIPVHPVTEKVCGICGIDPLRLLSSGAMLIACGNGDALARALEETGIKATVIGTAKGTEKRMSDGRKIMPPGADELYKIKI